jgi:hypothetical protein
MASVGFWLGTAPLAPVRKGEIVNIGIWLIAKPANPRSVAFDILVAFGASETNASMFKDGVKIDGNSNSGSIDEKDRHPPQAAGGNEGRKDYDADNKDDEDNGDVFK